MRAFITGASSGIGRELAHCFAADHYDLVLTARSLEPLEQLAQELREKYAVAVDVVVADLSVPGAAKTLFSHLEERKIEITFLVNNAGFGVYGPFHEHELTAEVEQLNVNIVALTELTHLFLPAMIARGHGRILNVASTAAFQAGPLLAVYCATKAYVLSFSEAIGHELQGTGVTVTCLCPGPTTTNFGQRSGFRMDERFSKKIATASEVASYGYKALFTGEPVAVHGLANRLVTLGSRLAPRSLVTKITAKILATSKSSQ